MHAGLFNPVLASSSVQAGIESPDRHLLESQGVCFLGAKKEVSMLLQSRRGPLELDIRATSRSRSEPRVARAPLAHASGATITARSIGRLGAVSTRRFSLPRWRRCRPCRDRVARRGFLRRREPRVVALACQKPKDLGYAEELRTLKLLAQHIQQRRIGANYPSLSKLAPGTGWKIVSQKEIHPHKISDYPE